MPDWNKVAEDMNKRKDNGEKIDVMKEIREIVQKDGNELEKKWEEKTHEHYMKTLHRVIKADDNSRDRLLRGLDKRGNKIYQKKMNITERLEKAEKIHQNHLRKIHEDTEKALRKLANRKN